MRLPRVPWMSSRPTNEAGTFSLISERMRQPMLLTVTSSGWS